jgi:hypothetical protein
MELVFHMFNNFNIFDQGNISVLFQHHTNGPYRFRFIFVKAGG